MSFKYVRIFIFIVAVGSMVYFGELGTPEIILIFMTLLLFALLGGIIFLIYSLVKRRNSNYQSEMLSNVPMNVNVPGSINETKNEENGEKRTRGDVQTVKIALPQQHEIRYVFINEIVRCEADDNYTNFYLSGGEKILISKSLKEYSDLLVPQGFLRTHQSHLINPSFVKSWLKEDGGVLLMNNGDKIPVSKPNRESVKGLLSR